MAEHHAFVDSARASRLIVARLRWWGATPTGGKIERETIDIVRFANGRAFEHWGSNCGPSRAMGVVVHRCA